MSKLFALENMDEQLTAGEMEVSPEEGEVADVQAEIGEEVGEMDDQVTAIEEGIDASGQMEQVEELVENAAEEGEGLDPVAADAVKIAVEAICARVGANPKTFYALYATENFQSASSRKANTRFALEGVGEFLKDMWKKIKAALQNLWAKAQAFWNKHVSSLGRIKKALESAKKTVSESSGKISDKAYLETAPAGLADTFPGSSDVSASVIQKYIATHRGLTVTSDAFNKRIEKINATAEKMSKLKGGDLKDEITNGMKDSIGEEKFGTEKEPMVGGVYITYKFEADKSEGDLTVEIERETIEKKHDSVGASISDKNALQALIKSTLEIINDTIKTKDKNDKAVAAFNKTMLNIEKAVNQEATTAKDSSIKNLRRMLKIVYKANAVQPRINNELFTSNVRLAKGVLSYVNVCVRQYK